MDWTDCLSLFLLVKPPPPERLALSMSASKEIHVQWSSPEGGTPAECLEYEVQLQGSDGHADAAWSVGITLVFTARPPDSRFQLGKAKGGVIKANSWLPSPAGKEGECCS